MTKAEYMILVYDGRWYIMCRYIKYCCVFYSVHALICRQSPKLGFASNNGLDAGSLPARHDESLADISCPCTWIPNFLYITKRELSAYALYCPSSYYFLYVTKGRLSAYALYYPSSYYFLYITKRGLSAYALYCPSSYYFLYITKGGLSAYALCCPGFYYFLYVTTLPSSDKVQGDGRKIKKSSQEVL